MLLGRLEAREDAKPCNEVPLLLGALALLLLLLLEIHEAAVYGEALAFVALVKFLVVDLDDLELQGALARVVLGAASKWEGERRGSESGRFKESGSNRMASCAPKLHFSEEQLGVVVMLHVEVLAERQEAGEVGAGEG